MNPFEPVRINTFSTLRGTSEALFALAEERKAQTRRFGRQFLPNGTKDDEVNRTLRDSYRAYVDSLPTPGDKQPLTWLDILQEEFLEVAAEEDPARLRAELIQLAAVAVSWIEAIDTGYIKPEVKGL